MAHMQVIEEERESLAPAPVWEECGMKEKGTGGIVGQGEKEEHETQSPERPGQGSSVARFCFID